MGGMNRGAVLLIWGLMGCVNLGPQHAEACRAEADAGPDAIELDAARDAPLDDTPVIGAPFSIRVEPLRFTVRAGETVRVPVEVIRAAGFDAPVTLMADGLPEAVYAEPSFEVPERPESALVLEASGRAPQIDDAPFVISGTSMGHRRELRVTLDVIEGVTDW